MNRNNWTLVSCMIPYWLLDAALRHHHFTTAGIYIWALVGIAIATRKE